MGVFAGEGGGLCFLISCLLQSAICCFFATNMEYRGTVDINYIVSFFSGMDYLLAVIK